MNAPKPPIKGASETYKQLLSFLQILLLYWAVLPSKRQEFLIMISLDFDWQTNEFMLYCRTTQLREKSMMAYEQSLKLFQRWCMDEMGIFTVDKVTENVIRRYIMELQERGKYTFYIVDKQKKTNYPERRRDFRQPISTATINNYIRNIRVFFNYLERNYIIKKIIAVVNQHIKGIDGVSLL